MSPAAAILGAGAFLLLATGALKLARPDPAVRALRSARLPAGAAGVRALGLAEIAIGSAALSIEAAFAPAAVAAAYAGFVAFIARYRAVGGAGGCGCFGADADIEPGAIHVVTNLFLAAGAAVTTLQPTALVPAIGSALGAGLVGLSLVGAYIVYVADTRLADLSAASR